MSHVAALCDASFCEEARTAGIAVIGVRPAHGFVAAEAMYARSPLEGEALAAIRAVTWCLNVAPRGARIVTDCQALTRRLEGRIATDRTHSDVRRTIEELGAMLKRHGYVLEVRPRSEVHEAHKIARAVLSAWKAGRSGEASWARTPYLR